MIFKVYSKKDPTHFLELLYDFHKKEYLVSNMESFGLHVLYPEIYNKNKDELNYISNEIIDGFIKSIEIWWKSHNTENPEVMFDSRYAEYLNYLDNLDNFEKPSMFYDIDLMSLNKWMSDSDTKNFLDEYFYKKYGQDAEQVWNDGREDEEDEDEEYEEDYDLMFGDVIDSSINDSYFIYFLFNNESIKGAVKKWWLSEGYDSVLKEWDDLGIIKSNENLVDLAKQCLDRLNSSRYSESIKEKSVAITLALNLEHNYGNLLEDHLGSYSTNFLNYLSDLDVSYQDKILEKMISNTGKSRKVLYEEEQWKKKNEEFGKNLMKDRWMEVSERERWGSMVFNLKKAKISGEWWILDDGSAVFADGDIGDFNHEAYAAQHIANILYVALNMYGYEGPLINYEDDIFNALIDKGLANKEDREKYYQDPADFTYERLEGKVPELKNDFMSSFFAGWNGKMQMDSRDYAIKNFGWKRLVGSVVETHTMTQGDLQAIASGINEVLGDEDESDPIFTIEVRATNTIYTDVPLSAIEEGNIRRITKNRIKYAGVDKMSDKMPGGLSDGKPDSKYNKKQLEKGRKIEKEHTNNLDKANEISKDHLEECSDYYTRLDKMENGCKKTKRRKSMKLAQVIKNHLSGKKTEASNELFSKISSKLQENGFKPPFKVVAFGESWERIHFRKDEHLERIKSMDDDVLQYTLNDLNKVIEAQERMRSEGYIVEKLGYYHDERHAILEEIHKRKQAGTWNPDPNDADFEQDLDSGLSEV